MVMRMARLLVYLLVDNDYPAVVKAAVRSARSFFFGLVDFKQLVPYDFAKIKEKNNIQTNNQFMLTALKKIGERISGKTNQKLAVQNGKDEQDDKKEDEEKFVVYSNINSQQEDYTFLVTALYHWEMLHKHI